MTGHTSIPQHNGNQEPQQQKHHLNKSEERYGITVSLPQLSGIIGKFKTQLTKWTTPLISWHEIMSNDYKLFPFLTPSNSRPSGISKIPPKILSQR